MLNNMKEQQVTDIMLNINSILPDLVSGIMNTKHVEEALGEELIKMLTQLDNLLKNEHYIPRKVACLLFKTYLWISTEANFIRNPNDNIALFKLTGNLEELLGDIFGKREFEF
jgi:hypothetical protein